MKKIKRSKEFEVVVTISDDDFINPPRESQRNAVLNRAVKEFTADLVALDDQTKRFVPGVYVNYSEEDRTQKVMADHEIMEDWLIPVMDVMARVTSDKGGDILEIGFGRGISSDMIQEHPIASHTIIECNDAVVEVFHKWKEQYEGKDIRLVHGLWQDTIDDLGLFDGIFFHTYPLDEDEYMNYVHASITFGEHFFSYASKHLKPGGAFTYFSNEINSLSREHQRILLQHFSSFSVEIVHLEMPDDVTDAWWADRIVVVKAVK